MDFGLAIFPLANVASWLRAPVWAEAPVGRESASERTERLALADMSRTPDDSEADIHEPDLTRCGLLRATPQIGQERPIERFA